MAEQVAAGQRKARFQFEALKANKGGLRTGEQGADVRALQGYLMSAGYLRRDCVPGAYCPQTERAVRHFQKCYGLADTGAADEDALRLI